MMYRLSELNPSYVKHGEYEHLAFDCPKCSKGSQIEIPMPPHPRAWSKQGDSFDNLTISPSIDFQHHNGDAPGANCHAHFFIRSGEIVWA